MAKSIISSKTSTGMEQLLKVPEKNLTKILQKLKRPKRHSCFAQFRAWVNHIQYQDLCSPASGSACYQDNQKLFPYMTIALMAIGAVAVKESTYTRQLCN